VSIKLTLIFNHKTNFLVPYIFTYNSFHIKPIRKYAPLCYNTVLKHYHVYVIRSQRLISRE